MIRRTDRPLRNVRVSFEVTRLSPQHLIDAYATLVPPIRRESGVSMPGKARPVGIKSRTVLLRRGEA